MFEHLRCAMLCFVGSRIWTDPGPSEFATCDCRWLRLKGQRSTGCKSSCASILLVRPVVVRCAPSFVEDSHVTRQGPGQLAPYMPAALVSGTTRSKIPWHFGCSLQGCACLAVYTQWRGRTPALGVLFFFCFVDWQGITSVQFRLLLGIGAFPAGVVLLRSWQEEDSIF